MRERLAVRLYLAEAEYLAAQRHHDGDAYDTARAEGVAAERARVVADLRRKADIVSVMRSMEATTTARALRERADRYERGRHDKEGER